MNISSLYQAAAKEKQAKEATEKKKTPKQEPQGQDGATSSTQKKKDE